MLLKPSDPNTHSFSTQIVPEGGNGSLISRLYLAGELASKVDAQGDIISTVSKFVVTVTVGWR